MNQFFDVVIVGGGPAGASAAIHLAQTSVKALLVEAKRFPRAKLCGEFISPECLAHFAKLGVLDEMLTAGGARLCETNFYARSGFHVPVPSAWFSDEDARNSSCALGLSRAEMDARLLRRARRAGAEVLEETKAVDLLFDEAGNARGVRLKTQSGVIEVGGKIFVDATGRARALARHVERKEREKQNGEKINSRHSKKRAPLVAFKAHLTDATPAANACEIYFYRGGYGGLSAVENNLSNLCFIVRADIARALGSFIAQSAFVIQSSLSAQNSFANLSPHKAELLLRQVLCQNKRAAETLNNARVASDWQAVALESFGRAALVPAKNLLTVGDAAAFIDPFTGSGILMALESGELAAQAITSWLKRTAHYQSDSPPPNFNELARDYKALYDAKFTGRLRACSYLRRAAFAPEAAIEAMAKILNASARVRRQLARATRHTTF